MGLSDRAKKLVADQLRPWLLCDVFPGINFSMAGITLQLPYLEFDPGVLNEASMSTSPLVFKGAVKVENVRLTFTPFRQPVLALVVKGWHAVLEPRSTEDPWWEKQSETTSEQKAAAALFEMDPQGAGVHVAAERLAEGNAGSSLVSQIVTSLMLTSVKLEFHDCSIRVMSHLQNERQHCCSIPLKSLEVGVHNDAEGFSLSGGLMGAVLRALRGVWKAPGSSISKLCVAKGFGLQVESLGVNEQDESGRGINRRKERAATEVNQVAQQYLSGPSSAETSESAAYETQEVFEYKAGNHLVLLEDVALSFRFVDLAMDAMDFDAPEAVFGLDYEEVQALQILSAQVSGPLQEVDGKPSGDQKRREKEVSQSRNPKSLWKKGIQKAMDLSSHRRLLNALHAGILRKRYSGLYEAWLLELGWGRSQDGWLVKSHSKTDLDHIKQLSRDISETQEKLPAEAIALARRLARRRVLANLHSSDEVAVTDTNAPYLQAQSKTFYSSVRGLVLRVLIMVMIFIRRTFMWLSAAHRLGVSEWNSIRGVVKGSWKDEAGGDDSPIFDDDSPPAFRPELSSGAIGPSALVQNISGRVHPEYYFQLGPGKEGRGPTTLPGKRNGWESVYTLRIRKGSITFTAGAVAAPHKGKYSDFRSRDGDFELERALIPAFHFSLTKLVLAYGSTATASGASIVCGSVKAELLSILPSELPAALSSELDTDILQTEFSSVGRWVARIADRALLLSSCPCPVPKKTALQAISDLPLTGGAYQKHWNWQDRHCEAWRKTWPKSRDAKSLRGARPSVLKSKDSRSGDNRPFLIIEYNDMDDDPSTDVCPGGLIRYSLAVGQLNFNFKGAFLTRICLMLNQLAAPAAPTAQSNRTGTDVGLPSQSQASVSFEQFWMDSYGQYLDACREAMVAAIPEKVIHLSAVIDGPRIRSGATATELHEYQLRGRKDTVKKKHKVDPNMGATVIFDFGRLEVAMWPPPLKNPEAGGDHLQQTGIDNQLPASWWNHEVDRKLWLRRPPTPALPQDFNQRRFWERVMVGNNLYISIEEVALTLERHKDPSKELPVVGPLALVFETSLCWDQYNSLFSTSKSVSAAVNGKIASVSVQSYIQEVSLLLQVVNFYMDALSPRPDPDSSSVLNRGDSSMALEAIVQEELAVLEESKNSDSKLEFSPSIQSVISAVCALTFSMELDKLSLVVGDSRHDGGDLSTRASVSSSQAQTRQDVGLRYEPREHKVQFDDDDDDDDDSDWERKREVGKEAYVRLQDVLFHVSLGDEEQSCMFAGMKDVLLWLMDSESVSSVKQLNEIRNQFFSTIISDRRVSPVLGYSSYQGTVLTEVFLEYFSMKAFGPSILPDPIDSKSVDTSLRPDYADNSIFTVPEGSGSGGDDFERTFGSQLTSQLSSKSLGDFAPTTDVYSPTKSMLRSLSTEQPPQSSDKDAEQPSSVQAEEVDGESSITGTHGFTSDVEVGKFLVTDGGLDALLAKIVLVDSGAESLHLNFGIDRKFEKVSLGSQGGLVLVHTAAVATLLQFCGDVGSRFARPATLSTTSEMPRQPAPLDHGELGTEESRDPPPPSLPSAYRSSSVPVPSAKKRKKKFKRTLSAPPLKQIPPATRSGVATVPTFEGVVLTKVEGFSLVLARHNTADAVPAEGVLFEVELSSMVEVGDNARKASFDLLRCTILGIQARVAGNSKMTMSRSASRIPQFASSSKLAGSSSYPNLLDSSDKALNQGSSIEQSSAFGEDLTGKKGGGGDLSPRDNGSNGSRHFHQDVSRRKEEEKAPGNSDSRKSSTPLRQASLARQAEGFHSALSEFNSYIMEHLSLHCAVEKLYNEDKVWKWTDAWHGQCSIVGFNVAITTSEIQLLENLVSPLSSSGGSPDAIPLESVANTLTDGSNEDAEDTEFDIPEGSVIALKDVREHCYLATEELPNNKGHYRLVGVLHYTLVGERALFKVKYQDPSTTQIRMASLSLLSLHAKDPDGEPYCVHCRADSALADLSISRGASWEQWRFIPAESARDSHIAELDFRNPALKNSYHMVNQKTKSGIALEERAPVMVPQPGNPFKVKLVARPHESRPDTHKYLAEAKETPLQTPPLDDQEAVGLVTSIPHVLCVFNTITFTVLHEAAGGQHLLPLIRLRVPGTQGVVQAGLSKTRTILQCSVVLEYYETQSSLWVSIINPIETDVFYRARSTKQAVAANQRKIPVAFFLRFKKVDFVISEPSLDALLFLIGALDLAGPYTVRYSPATANRCLVDNQTGVDALCCFDQGSSKLDGIISSWHSDSFLMRHMNSRRDVGPAKVASILELYLQKSGNGATSPVYVTLADPGVLAVKTRLRTDQGQRFTGPMVVVDVSRRTQDGISVRISPMVRIRNSTGLPVELRCRRDSKENEGAVVVLDSGDTIDDSMGAFDALNLEGDMKKALSSLNLGNFLLSVRPLEAAPTEDAESHEQNRKPRHEWSEDVKGAKPVRSAKLFDKLQYSFNKNQKAGNLESTFGVVYCAAKTNLKSSKSSQQAEDVHFLIRSTCRQVPVSKLKSVSAERDMQKGQYSVIAWRQQQEILLLPTIRVLNLMTSSVSILLASSLEGGKGKKGTASSGTNLPFNAAIKSFDNVSMYVDLGDLFLTIKHEDLDLVSKPICLGAGTRDFSQSSNNENLKDIETEVNFGDGIHTALVSVSRGKDGVLEVVLVTRYTLRNDSLVTLHCCSSKPSTSRRWGGLRAPKNQELEWPSSGIVMTLAPKSQLSWFDRSTHILVKRNEARAQPALLDLESVSGAMEISLKVQGRDNVDNRIQLGVQLNAPTPGDANPSCSILLVPRYIVANESGEAILVCQDGYENDNSAAVSLGPGERSALHAQALPDEMKTKTIGNEEVGAESLLTVRFRPKEAGWNWSGPVCAAALGSFSVKIRRPRSEESKLKKTQKEGSWFAVADVQQQASSLITTFRRQAADAVPYRIENALRSASITYSQQGLDNFELLETGASVGYVWDDLGESHYLTVNLAGTSFSNNINPDKLRSWKSFRAARRTTGLLQIPFLNEITNMAAYGDEDDVDDYARKESGLPPVGYEVYADGPTRVVRICEEKDSRVDQWQSEASAPTMEMDVRIPLFTMTFVEPAKQPAEREAKEETEPVAYVPVACLRLTNLSVEAIVTPEFTLCQVKAEGLDVDVKWQGAPVAAMLRGHGQDRFAKGQTMVHMAVVMSNVAVNPIQLKYASILLQAMDLNLDEDTLMKLAPFYRYSLSESTAPSLQIYFERFEIHPIKIVGSFLPGNPRADYSSGQETLRALLHSVIKIPTVRGNNIELNGVLLSNALLTFKQLALKCAQHYSWYSMRAIYIARGSKLLPPGFASLFDDSAASSLDVFFDPASGAIDLQGLTIGMFGMLSRGLRKRGKGGTQRYLGDLQHTVKAAGSNLLFAVVTEVSDSVLKGADASGLDGLLVGFRRGILNVAMKPSVLRGAVVHGGSTRRIKLDRIVGTDEAYIEGYLQAMLDALFKQNYLRVKVIDDQVILKNLPPNTTIMEEIVSCARNFLIGEGLLAGESSAAALSSLRRLRGEEDRKFGPTVIALCEQLLVIIVVRSLRRQTIKVLHKNNIFFFREDQPEKVEPTVAEEEQPKEQPRHGILQGINFKRAVTGFALSSALAYADGRICRFIPNPLVRRIVSGFLLSFVE